MLKHYFQLIFSEVPKAEKQLFLVKALCKPSRIVQFGQEVGLDMRRAADESQKLETALSSSVPMYCRTGS